MFLCVSCRPSRARVEKYLTPLEITEGLLQKDDKLTFFNQLKQRVLHLFRKEVYYQKATCVKPICARGYHHRSAEILEAFLVWRLGSS